MKYLFAMLLLCLSCLSIAAEDKKSSGTVIGFSVEASQTVSNDLARATVFAAATDPRSAEVARKVNAAMAKAIALAKNFPEVKTRSGSTWTSPVYSKNGRTIEAWNMRSELELESQKVSALGELVGILQDDLAVSQITLQPSPETRRKAEDQATLDALNAFQAKAQVVSSSFRKSYRMVKLNIGGGGRGPMLELAAAPMMKTAAPMPIENGESTVNVTVSGEIELVD